MIIECWKIDKAQMPPGTPNTEDSEGTPGNPNYWYTYYVPQDDVCANAECPSVVHAGLVWMKPEQEQFWADNQSEEEGETMDADIVSYCATHFMPAVQKLNE